MTFNVNVKSRSLSLQKRAMSKCCEKTWTQLFLESKYFTRSQKRVDEYQSFCVFLFLFFFQNCYTLPTLSKFSLSYLVFQFSLSHLSFIFQFLELKMFSDKMIIQFSFLNQTISYIYTEVRSRTKLQIYRYDTA